MLVRFASSRLETCYQNLSLARREWGPRVARAYVQRINTLYAARDGRDLFALRSLDFHPLKGERRGQYAIRLGDRERLIVTFGDEALTIKHYGD